MAERERERRALVVSGGGSKGAWAVGAVWYLVKKLGIHFDVVAGTSTGSLIAPLVVRNEVARQDHPDQLSPGARKPPKDAHLAEFYTSVTTKRILRWSRWRSVVFSKHRCNSVTDTWPLQCYIEDYLDDERLASVISSERHMFLATVCLESGEPVYWYTGPEVANEAADLRRVTYGSLLRKVILASCNQPILMPPVIIPWNGRKEHYVDGGVREYAPVRVVSDALGLRKICAVVLTPQRLNYVPGGWDPQDSPDKPMPDFGDIDRKKKPKDCKNYWPAGAGEVVGPQWVEELVASLQSTAAIALRTVAMFTTETANNDIAARKRLGNDELIVLRPEDELIENDMYFDPMTMHEMMKAGWNYVASKEGDLERWAHDARSAYSQYRDI